MQGHLSEQWEAGTGVHVIWNIISQPRLRAPKGQYTPNHHYSLKAKPSSLYLVFFSGQTLAGKKILASPKVCSAVKDHYPSSGLLYSFCFLSSRICLYWRITTGDLQLACFGNQGFLLTCQRKWRKCCRDETDWCAHSKDKSRSPGHAGTPVSVAGSQLLVACPPLIVQQEIQCQVPQPKNQNISVHFERVSDGLWPKVGVGAIIYSSLLSHSSATRLCTAKFLSLMLANRPPV